MKTGRQFSVYFFSLSVFLIGVDLQWLDRQRIYQICSWLPHWNQKGGLYKFSGRNADVWPCTLRLASDLFLRCSAHVYHRAPITSLHTSRNILPPKPPALPHNPRPTPPVRPIFHKLVPFASVLLVVPSQSLSQQQQENLNLVHLIFWTSSSTWFTLISLSALFIKSKIGNFGGQSKFLKVFSRTDFLTSLATFLSEQRTIFHFIWISLL